MEGKKILISVISQLRNLGLTMLLTNEKRDSSSYMLQGPLNFWIELTGFSFEDHRTQTETCRYQQAALGLSAQETAFRYSLESDFFE